MHDIIVIPEDFDLSEFSKADPARILVVAPYCLKNTHCPAGRNSEKCILNCKLCDISSISLFCKLKGMKFRVETEGKTQFMDYLADHYIDYDLLVAFACPYVMNKIGYAVHKIFGLRGVVAPLKGDVCRSEKKYLNGIKGKNFNQTQTDLKVLLRILETVGSPKSISQETCSNAQQLVVKNRRG